MKRMEEQQNDSEVHVKWRCLKLMKSEHSRKTAVSFQLKLIFNLRLAVSSSILGMQCFIQFLDRLTRNSRVMQHSVVPKR